MKVLVEFDHSISRDEVQGWIDTLADNHGVHKIEIVGSDCDSCGKCKEARNASK